MHNIQKILERWEAADGPWGMEMGGNARTSLTITDATHVRAYIKKLEGVVKAAIYVAKPWRQELPEDLTARQATLLDALAALDREET